VEALSTIGQTIRAAEQTDLKTAPDARQPAIEIAGISKRFVTRGRVVDALGSTDLTISEGEFVCVVGPSGCGKSTLLRILANLIRPTTGQVTLRQSVAGSALFAVVFQDYSVFPWKTVEDNVAFGMRMSGSARREARLRAHEWIRRLGLSGFEKAFPATLSGGMNQRVAIARALALDPEILLMDEPFAALDAQLREVLQEELLAQWEEKSRTAVFVTHSLDEAILLGDRIVLMSRRPGRIRRVFEVPFGRPRDPKIRATEAFGMLREEIWEALRDDVLASLEEQT
jgi:NitT/TauT family transport system ATP-binding protein